MAVELRPAREDDLEAAAELVRHCIVDLKARHGLKPAMPQLATHFPRLCLSMDGRGLWVAEAGMEIVGFGFSWLADHFWFLAQLFVHPQHQGSRIGRALLAKTLEHADLAGANNRALITFAFNPQSIGLYVRHGLYPRLPLYRWSLKGPPCIPSAQRAPMYQCVPMQHVPATEWIDKIDADALGFRRAQHHAHLRQVHPGGGIQITRSGEPVGYAYLASNGHIGPLAMKSSECLGEALLAVIAHAALHRPERLSVIIPGPDERASGAASALGFRIAEPLLLMSARPFGSLKYCPRDPGFM